MRELVILTADGTMNAVVSAFFSRQMWHMTLACGAFDLWPEQDIFNQPGNTDGAVHTRAHEILRPYLNTHRRALVLLDWQFGGERPAIEVRDEILGNLRHSGWRQPEKDCEVIVIDPELEVWLWQDNPNVAQAVCFPDGGLREHLRTQGIWPAGQLKPTNPKDTMQDLIRKHRAGAFMAVYSKIARSVGGSKCQDASFGQLRAALQTWFPAEGA